MDMPEKLYGALLRMTYATQFSSPMSAGVERTLAAIVWPFLFKFQPEQYLQEIEELLASDYVLNEQEFTEKRTNTEVKLYLEELSMAIEREFPTVARSGSVAKLSGKWRCLYCNDEIEKNFEIGNIFPTHHTCRCIWKLQPSHVSRSAMEALTEELCTFYTKKSMRNSFSISDPEEYAIETANRLARLLSEGQRNELINVLFDLKSRPTDSYFKMLKEKSEVDWPGHKDSWRFFEQFCSILASQMSDSLK